MEGKTNNIWQQWKIVYDVVDACNTWYLKIREEFIKLRGNVSKVDESAFYLKEKESIRLVIYLGHDIIWVWEESF